MDTARSERKEKTTEETQLERNDLGREATLGGGEKKNDTYELDRKDPYIVHDQMAVHNRQSHDGLTVDVKQDTRNTVMGLAIG